MDAENQLLAAAACVILLTKSKKKPRKRRFWVRPTLRSRSQYSGTHLLEDLKRDDFGSIDYGMTYRGSFKNFCRLSSSDFEHLLSLIGPKIRKNDTRLRDAIPINERLAVTLRFLATGDSYQSLMYLFKISKQSISLIVPEVCDAIIEVLQRYIKLPASPDKWKVIANGFYEQWNFPNCCGSMDEKHVMIQAPISSGSEYFNYKGYFSIVLFAVVDAKYCFTYVNTGCQGRISDGGVYANTTLNKLVEENALNFPEPCGFPERSIEVPYVFVSDEAFPLQTHIMKPYPGLQDKGSGERIFNYRLSRARRVVENVFGIMSSVFRVLRKPMLLEPKKAEKIVLACVCLHNFLRRSATSKCLYTPPGTFDIEDSETGEVIPGKWREDQADMTSLLPMKNVPKKSSQAAYAIRNEFRNYFLSDQGKVS